MVDDIQVFDTQRCQLGEGPLWHPLRNELFWFDIPNRKLHFSAGDARREWAFDEFVSAAGWVDETRLLIASETQILCFDVEHGTQEHVAALEDDKPGNRSNDGRADPHGGFWIGTMGKEAEPGAGAIYRFFQGRLEKVVDHLTIPNAICFAPDGRTGYFTDTVTRKIMCHALDEEGWPIGEPGTFADLSDTTGDPDGAVVGCDGCLWVAMWGGSELRCYAPSGEFRRALPIPALQLTCPAFGGKEANKLFVTSARAELENPSELDGATFLASFDVAGRHEPRVILG